MRKEGIKGILAGAASLMLVNSACAPAAGEPSVAKLAPTPTSISRVEPTPTFAPTPTATEKPSDSIILKRYDGPDYVISYPEDWEIIGGECVKNPKSAYPTRISVGLIGNLSKPKDFAYQSELIFNQAKAVPGNKVQGYANEKIREYSTYKLVTTTTSERYGEPVISITYLTIMNDQVWKLSFTTLQSQSKESIEVFEKVAQTLIIPYQRRAKSN